MTIDARLLATLKTVADVMNAARAPWWIIASAAVALHGADPEHIGDVDVLLSIADATRILPSLGIPTEKGSKHPDFRSTIFGTWGRAPLPIEFMAGFSYRSKTQWLPVEPRTRKPIAVDGVTVFAPERAELIGLLTAFGRPKDIERARRLAALA
jgi:hypothetical protein